MLTAAALVASLLPLVDTEAQTVPRAPEGSRLIVLDKSDDTASFLDPNTGVILATLPTGAGPHEVAVSPDGRVAVVADYGHQVGGSTLTVLELAGEAPEVRGKLDLGEYTRPHGIQFAPDGESVFVTAESQKALLEVELDGSGVRALPTDQQASHMVALSPDGTRGYVANIGSGSLSVFDLEAGERLANVPTGAQAEGLDVHPAGAEVWVANRAADTISVVDAASLEVAATIDCGAFPIRLKFTPDGKRALVSNAQSGDVAVFDVASRELVARIPMEAPAAEGDEKRMFDAAFSEGPVPIGILVQPDGRFAYVANTNADLVTVLDLEALAVAGRFATGRQPDGLAWVPAPRGN